MNNEYVHPKGKYYDEKNINYILKAEEILANTFKSITELSYYKKKYRYTKCKNAKIWGEQQLSLPFHAKMNNHEVITVCKTLRDFFKKKLFNDLQIPKAN